MEAFKKQLVVVFMSDAFDFLEMVDPMAQFVQK